MQEERLCRFCLETKETAKNPLLDACGCKGSMRYVHMKCLHRWRFQNPSKNAETCLLCFEPYTIPSGRLLEVIPPETGVFILFLRYPVILTFTGGYLSLLHFTLDPSISKLSTLSVVYQYGVQIFYFTLLYFHWNVKKKEDYWQHWQPLRRSLLFSLYLLSLLGISNQNYVSILPLNFVLAMIWPVHSRILEDMNAMTD